jgi:hypothetical protein
LICSLFGLVLTLHLLKLLPLIFDFLLLRLDLALGLSLLIFIVLHLVTHYVSAEPADTCADSRARKRSAYCRTDYRAGRGPDTCSDKSTLLSRREWLSRACGDCHNCDRYDQALNYRRCISSHSFLLPSQQFSCLPHAPKFLTERRGICSSGV